MREYYVTTNTDIVLELPVLTVLVRCGMWDPPETLEPRESDEGGGREAWIDAKPVFPFFKLSERIVTGDKVVFHDVVDLDKEKIHAKLKKKRAGIVATDLRSQWASNREVGQAKIPLWGLEKGDYILGIVPDDKERTKPDEPSGPSTTIEPGVDRTFRPLWVMLTLDDEQRLEKAVTVIVDEAKNIFRHKMPIVVHGKKVGWDLNHGYVTATSKSELAVDMKPDFVRTARTDDARKGTTVSGKFTRAVDIIVVHGTGGKYIGTALNTALGKIAPGGHPFGPHYEIDHDGHTLKFAYDDTVANHSGMAKIYSNKNRAYQVVGGRSIGIEVINRLQDKSVPQEVYREPQMIELTRLLFALMAAHPDVKSHRVVGHSCVRLNDAGTVLSDDRLMCPGRNLPWPRLEKLGIGRPCVERALTKADYSGFFSLKAADFPPKFPDAPGADGLFLSERGSQTDDAQNWGRINWKGKTAVSLLAKKGLTFKDIIKEVQTDLQILGYFVNVNGKIDHVTSQAIKHSIWHTFSGERRGLIPGGNGLKPDVLVNETVARYLKGSVDAMLALVGGAGTGAPAGTGTGAPAGTGPGAPAGAASAPHHTELEEEVFGDLHDRVAEVEEDDEERPREPLEDDEEDQDEGAGKAV